jgi:hypothetical protein
MLGLLVENAHEYENVEEVITSIKENVMLSLPSSKRMRGG